MRQKNNGGMRKTGADIRISMDFGYADIKKPRSAVCASGFHSVQARFQALVDVIEDIDDLA